jgi:hypothetical protein
MENAFPVACGSGSVTHNESMIFCPDLFRSDFARLFYAMVRDPL